MFPPSFSNSVLRYYTEIVEDFNLFDVRAVNIKSQTVLRYV